MGSSGFITSSDLSLYSSMADYGMDIITYIDTLKVMLYLVGYSNNNQQAKLLVTQWISNSEMSLDSMRNTLNEIVTVPLGVNIINQFDKLKKFLKEVKRINEILKNELSSL